MDINDDVVVSYQGSDMAPKGDSLQKYFVTLDILLLLFGLSIDIYANLH